MDAKEMKIVPPEGYEIDRENSTFECIKFKPKHLTYGNVVRTLFEKQPYYYYISPIGTICINTGYSINYNIALSAMQLQKLLAINKLMNVAKYLCPDFKPKKNEMAWSIYIDTISDKPKVAMLGYANTIDVYFPTEEATKQAIDILGEDTIRLALSTDW